MATCVEITLEDDGSFSVKECEPKEEAYEMQGEEGMEGGEMGGKQPAQSLDEAFSIAKGIFDGSEEAPQEQQSQGFAAVAKQFGKGGM